MGALLELKPGSTLDRYEILMPVAQGGMAAVWAARMAGSRGFTKIVAIKTMLPHMSDDPDFEAMFIDEATLASRIRHPHVVEIVDVGEDEELVYLVMEWVNGETMFTLNKRAKIEGGIPLPLLLRMASTVCAGLHAAHELRNDKGELVDLVHRDVSPQNVMISFDGIVKLVDFGVAKAAGRAHETRVSGLMKGKVPYLSPEQLTSGSKVDRRSDIFSLGILLYVMISGRHPFRGPTDNKTMENISTRDPVPLTELVPDCRPDLEAIVLRALAKDPDDRWSSCAEMQRALDSVLTAVGATVTEGDIAAFVRKVMGDVIDDRNKRLADAIAASDARAQSGSHRVKVPRVRSSNTPSEPAQPSPGKPTVIEHDAPVDRPPLPATFEGILPVSLDSGPESDRAPRKFVATTASESARASSAAPPSRPRRTPGRLSTPRFVEPPRVEPPRSRGETPAPSASTVGATSRRPRRRSQWPLFAFGLVALAMGVGLAVRAGVIPAPFGIGKERAQPLTFPTPERKTVDDPLPVRAPDGSDTAAVPTGAPTVDSAQALPADAGVGDAASDAGSTAADGGAATPPWPKTKWPPPPPWPKGGFPAPAPPPSSPPPPTGPAPAPDPYDEAPAPTPTSAPSASVFDDAN